jgi:hypothetical protein
MGANFAVELFPRPRAGNTHQRAREVTRERGLEVSMNIRAGSASNAHPFLTERIRMTTASSAAGRRWLVFVLLLAAAPLRAQDYFELTATTELVEWHMAGVHKPDPWEVRCVVGTNRWWMDGVFLPGAKGRAWFDGTSLVVCDKLPKPPLKNQRMLNYTNETGTFMQVATPEGQRWTETAASADGNPGRPVRVADLLTLDGRIAWLAFCSGPAFRRADRVIYPPNDLWKEVIGGKPGFLEKAELFPDDLGLPRSVWLRTAKGQTVMRYGVVTSTNVCGWDFPREFYLAQYRPGLIPGTNVLSSTDWEVDYVAKGTLTSIRPSRMPENF